MRTPVKDDVFYILLNTCDITIERQTNTVNICELPVRIHNLEFAYNSVMGKCRKKENI